MRNMPKVIGTGKDIYNLLGMVQAGTLEAAELREVINGSKKKVYLCSGSRNFRGQKIHYY